MEFKLDDFEIPIREVLESGGVFRIYPKGSSMLPLFRQKIDSVVLIKPHRRLKAGDIPLYKRSSGQFVLHRVVKVNQQDYELCGDNQTQIETGITDDDIIGVVDHFYRGVRKITNHNVCYKLYQFLWKFFFLRKIVWKAKRIVTKFLSIF